MLPASWGSTANRRRYKPRRFKTAIIGSDIDAHAQRLDPRQPLIEQLRTAGLPVAAGSLAMPVQSTMAST